MMNLSRAAGTTMGPLTRVSAAKAIIDEELSRADNCRRMWYDTRDGEESQEDRARKGYYCHRHLAADEARRAGRPLQCR